MTKHNPPQQLSLMDDMMSEAPGVPADQSDQIIIMDLLNLRQLQRLSALDWHFGEFIQQLNQQPCAELQLASVLLSHELAKGHVCIDLQRVAYSSGLSMSCWPDPEHWCALLGQQATVNDVSQPQDDAALSRPLVLDGYRLYMNRYWQYERALSDDLLQRSQSQPVADSGQLRDSLLRYFGPASEDMIDWQKVAAAVCVTRRFSVVSGGPGTGKTTTVTKLLLIYIEQYLLEHPGKFPHIRLAAPTGKAAARLSESIKQAKAELSADLKQRLSAETVTDTVTETDLLAAIPEEAGTLHRLLGGGMNGRRFRHHRDNPLILDLLVLDEASMVDLSMMSALLDALSPDTRLILLGDRDQLSSVEAGGVLGDICAQQIPVYSEELSAQLAELCDDPRLLAPVVASPAAIADDVPPDSPLANSICLLRHSYRFSGDSGIGRLSSAVNNGDMAAVRSVLAESLPDLLRHNIDQPSYRRLLQLAVQGYTEYLSLITSEHYDPLSVLKAFARFQVLCAVNEGDFGTLGLNQRIESALRKQQLLADDAHWYCGRPLMIIRNDYSMKLFNGDIGLVLPDPERDGELRACFQMADGKVRFVTPGRLPEHVTVFAMTVHKSQGSEFDHPVLVLPPEHSPLMTRELLYTGITRARSKLDLFVSDDVLQRSVATRTQRISGLAGRLWR